ncbi:MAG: hypothetical protein M9901_10620 [Lentimicrobium sp.]|nr:hypothetical protein [Lentimicrobium sp.]
MADFSPEGVYRQMLGEAVSERDKLAGKARRYSVARLITFLAFVAGVYLSVSSSPVWWIASVVLLAGFIILMIRHGKVLEAQKLNRAQIMALEQEVEACKGNYTLFEGGASFADSHHPYATDLDLFGDFSLFQALNRTVSPLGKETLAAWLRNLLNNPDEIRMRQEAVKELSAMPGWRIKFRALGMVADESENDLGSFYQWLETPELFSSPVFRVAVVLIPVLSFAILLLLSAGLISIQLFLLYLLIPLSLTGFYTKRINRRHVMLSRKVDLLQKYASRFAMVEQEPFTSAQMLNYKGRLQSGNNGAGNSINKLGRITSSLDTRLNFLAGFVLNVLLLWDIRQIRRLEEWQRANRRSIPVWFGALAETEAIASIAAFAYCNPAYIFPETASGSLMLSAEEAGHPLIEAAGRVNNNVSLQGKGYFNIITGANMAGKSTYLRTIGVNLVLAMCGSPVCARSFTFYPAGIYTSLRTTDSLSASQSYFFAELLRLKELIDRLNAGEALYILLDEILKGTNSADKQAGSKALLRQLIGMEASGFIATHDLELGRLAEAFPERIINHSFEAVIDGDALHFDYKLKPGIARNMNATFLMQRMGITIKYPDSASKE